MEFETVTLPEIEALKPCPWLNPTLPPIVVLTPLVIAVVAIVVCGLGWRRVGGDGGDASVVVTAP